MHRLLVILFLGICYSGFSQFQFSGYVNANDYQNTVYLSLVEDYRKINGVHSEQIIAKTIADSSGYFEFKGNMLSDSNRIYRIHVDKCSESEQDINHFNGHCKDSKALIFIANNNDKLELPFSFENQVFCNIVSTNPKANAFTKIDSLKADMRFAYGEFRSEANRKLNNKKWFKTLQDYGKSLNEPLAELYIYAYLSDRTSDLHSYYVQDLKSSSYYSELRDRLTVSYPDAKYTKQYNNELASDQYMINFANTRESGFRWDYLLYFVLGISVIINVMFLYRIQRNSNKKETINLRDKLSNQEQVVLDLMLENKTNKEIAESLFLSISTVKTHINNIYKKLEVNSRNEAKSLFVS